jgi:hypothetical protein
MFTLKENIDRKNKTLEKIKEVLKLGNQLLKKDEYFNTIEVAIYDTYMALEPKGYDGFTECRRKLKKAFPEYKDVLYSIDSPCGNYWLIRYHTGIKRLEIWVHYDNEKDIPKSYFKKGKCGIKTITKKEKVFVCEN